LQRYNAKYKAFVNIDSVEEISDGDRVSVTKLGSEDGVDMKCSASDKSGNQHPGSDVSNRE